MWRVWWSLKRVPSPENQRIQGKVSLLDLHTTRLQTQAKGPGHHRKNKHTHTHTETGQEGGPGHMEKKIRQDKKTNSQIILMIRWRIRGKIAESICWNIYRKAGILWETNVWQVYLTQMKSAETNAEQILCKVVDHLAQSGEQICSAYKHLTTTSTPGDWNKEK